MYQLHSPQFDHLPVTAVRFMKDRGNKDTILLAACKFGKFPPIVISRNVIAAYHDHIQKLHPAAICFKT